VLTPVTPQRLGELTRARGSDADPFMFHLDAALAEKERRLTAPSIFIAITTVEVYRLVAKGLSVVSPLSHGIAPLRLARPSRSKSWKGKSLPTLGVWRTVFCLLLRRRRRSGLLTGSRLHFAWCLTKQASKECTFPCGVF
jgi:hypothetical protein